VLLLAFVFHAATLMTLERKKRQYALETIQHSPV
jgi:hypothetical protein